MSDQSNTEHDDETDPNEYDAFEELTRKLIGISKADMDAARAKPSGD